MSYTAKRISATELPQEVRDACYFEPEDAQDISVITNGETVFYHLYAEDDVYWHELYNEPLVDITYHPDAHLVLTALKAAGILDEDAGD